MEEIKKEKSTHGGRRSGAGRKYKQDVFTKVMRVPATDVKTVQVLIDLIHAHTTDRSYRYSNKEVVEVIDKLQWTVSQFKEWVQEGRLDSVEDIPLRYKVKGF